MVQSSSRPSALSYPKDLRPKQKEVIEAFRDGSSFEAVQLPTGYGKTLAAAGAFAQLILDNKCNRILAVVPRRNQANQMAEELPAGLSQFEVKSGKARIVGVDRASALRAHADGSTTIFIVTIQSLLSSKTWETVAALMQVGKWFAFIDEHQHYGDDGGWTDRIKNLNFIAMLAASATAQRHDGKDHFPKPRIKETYVNAAEEGFVKKLELHAYHYTLDAITVDGNVINFTTEELAREAGSDQPEAIEAYMTSRKMRFSPKYISPLVSFPADRIIDLRTRGIKAQMLIQAMSCSHAKCVIEQVRGLLPEQIKCDWVGTGPNGRPDGENDEVLKRFCPPKDRGTGVRHWSLDVLVNVGMAGEGLDIVDAAEIVFLTPANNTLTNQQTIGRASRLIKNLPAGMPQPVARINVDTGSELATDRYLRNIMLIFDDPIDLKEPELFREPQTELNDYKELPDRLGWMIADVRLEEIRKHQMFKTIYDETRKQTDLARTDSEIAAIAEKVLFEYLNRSNNQTAIDAQKKDQIDSACSKIAGLVIRRMVATGMRPERTLSGDLRRRINRKKMIAFGSVEGADAETLDKHWAWIKELERQILLGHALEGVPQWLR